MPANTAGRRGTNYSMNAWARATNAMRVPETWKTPSAPLAAVGLRLVADAAPVLVPVASVPEAVVMVATVADVAVVMPLIVVGVTPEVTPEVAPEAVPVEVTLNWPD